MSDTAAPSKPLVIFGDHDQKTVKQMETCMADAPAARGVICADGHYGYAHPVGGVVAYHDHVSISGVGYDIACGVKVVRTNLSWCQIERRSEQIANTLARHLSFGVGRNSSIKIDDPLFDDEAWKNIPILKSNKRLAEDQLSSIGSGNHWCDVFSDENDKVWIGCHFGSRGLGHRTASHFLQVAGGRDGMDVPPCVVGAKSALGSEYLVAMELCGRYAYAGRNIVCAQVADILEAEMLEEVHNHHNFCWKEVHDGEELYVVRKGATPAFPGQRGAVGASMGGVSAIVVGVDSEASRNALYSTVHGAGRVMSRTQAAGKSKWIKDEATGRKVKTRIAEGLINEDSMRQRIKNQGIELRGGGADEAPEVYRDLDRVLMSHAGTIEVQQRLTPRIVIMAGADIVDPYKD